jgi:hypothetical protein
MTNSSICTKQAASVIEDIGSGAPSTLYRTLNLIHKPHAAHRAEGRAGALLRADCGIEVTHDKQAGATFINPSRQLLEDYGVETEQGLVKVPNGVLRRPTIDHYLSLWGLDQTRLSRQPPATRFQAENSNDCWQFDLSPSDLKHIGKPDWIDPSRGMADALPGAHLQRAVPSRRWPVTMCG